MAGRSGGLLVSMWAGVVGFAAVAGLLTIIPGLDTALVLRAALTGGRRAGFATAVGVNTGALVWAGAATVGVSAVLQASRTAYDVMRVAGAVYMIWLGARIIRSAFRDTAPRSGLDTPAAAVSVWRSWRRGLVTNLANPKVGAFYVAVLPQFIPPHAPHLAIGLLLGGVHGLEATVWFSVIITGAQTAWRWLQRRAARRAVDVTTGAVLIGFGTRLGLAAH